MNEQVPLPYGVAARGEIRCVVNTVRLLWRHRVHLPLEHVGMRLRFANGTSAPVFRETVIAGRVPEEPCVLLVEFRLRAVRGWGHALFRRESLLNTPLFVGFRGFVSKLWLANDECGVYRGVYDWDGSAPAEYYARCLWRVLALVSVPGSIHYQVLPGLRRDELLHAPGPHDAAPPAAASAWWRLVEVS